MNEGSDAHAIFTRNKIKIRRDHTFEAASSQLNALAEEDPRGVMIFSLGQFPFQEIQLILGPL
ncbi:hypothetical protein CASFOL_001734 [Castilleja foliolosa]